MTGAAASLICLMHRYLGGLLDPFVTLLEVHELMYFMQEAGQPLRLGYVRALYGPYAENLRHVLHEIEGFLFLDMPMAAMLLTRSWNWCRGRWKMPRRFSTTTPRHATDLSALRNWCRVSRRRSDSNCYRPCTGSPRVKGARSADESVQRVYAWVSARASFRRGRLRLRETCS